jgi:hypothetical protein
LKVSRRFGGTYRLHLKGRKNKLALLTTCFRAGFLLGLFFDAEDGGYIFLRNIGWLSAEYAALYPRRYLLPLRELEPDIHTSLGHNMNILRWFVERWVVRMKRGTERLNCGYMPSRSARNSELLQIVETLLHISRKRGAGGSPVDIVTTHAMPKAVRLPASHILSQVRSCGICGGQCSIVAGFPCQSHSTDCSTSI